MPMECNQCQTSDINMVSSFSHLKSILIMEATTGPIQFSGPPVGADTLPAVARRTAQTIVDKL